MCCHVCCSLARCLHSAVPSVCLGHAYVWRHKLHPSPRTLGAPFLKFVACSAVNGQSEARLIFIFPQMTSVCFVLWGSF